MMDAVQTQVWDGSQTNTSQGQGRQKVLGGGSTVPLCRWKLPEAHKAVFPRTPWEPLAQPRAQLISPESFKDNPFSPNQVYFLTESQWKEPFDFSDLGRVPNAPKNPLLHSQATLSKAEKNFNLCFCRVLTQSQVKGGGSAGALAPHWQFYENDLFLSLLVISHVSHGVCWYHLCLSFCSAVGIQTE